LTPVIGHVIGTVDHKSKWDTPKLVVVDIYPERGPCGPDHLFPIPVFRFS